MNRRELLKATIRRAAATVAGLRWGGLRQASCQSPPQRQPEQALPSPSCTPFAARLFVPPIKAPVGSVDPPPDSKAHQLWERYSPVKFYEIHEQEFRWAYHPDPPYNAGSWAWGYDGVTPGSTFHARYGEPILVRRHNALPPVGRSRVTFALPSTSSHLHNAHTASESDGYPQNFIDSGEFWDHHYGCFPAGGDPNEKLTTLWYHDQRMDFSAANVYAGLAGFFCFFDEQDSNNETDPNPDAWRLPSGKYDVPLLLQDMRFDRNGQVLFDQYSTNGLVGDRYTVNRTIQPYFRVERRKYRFRILNGGPSRFYQLFLNRKNRDVNFTVIAGDGNFLTRPLEAGSIYLSLAQRCDVIVDFAQFEAGDSVYLQNRLMQSDAQGPGGRMMDVESAGSIMRFDVLGDRVADPSRVPDCFRNLPALNFGNVKRRRRFEFDYDGGYWTVNGKTFDPNRVDARIEQGTAEIWTLRNRSKNAVFPIHNHLTQFILLKMNGTNLTPVPDKVLAGAQAMPGNHTLPDVMIASPGSRHPAWAQVSQPCAAGQRLPSVGVFTGGRRRDVLALHPSDELVVYMKWADFLGRYVMHGQNLIQGDHGMMIRWDVVPPGQG